MRQSLGHLGIWLLCSFSLTVAADWPTDYQAAVAQGSCADYLKLSQQNFDIQKLARVRYLASCTKQPTSAIQELDGLAGNAAMLWLKPLVIDTLITLAQKSGDSRMLVKYALAHETALGSQREKELFLQEAITAASKIKDGASTKTLQAELYKVSPRLIPSPTSSEWMKVADDFKNNGTTADAIRYYDKILASNAFDTIAHAAAMDGIRQVYKNAYRNSGGKLSDFLGAGLKLATFCDQHLKAEPNLPAADRQALFNSWLQYPRDQWSYGDESTAKADLQTGLNKNYFEPLFHASVDWYLAKIAAGDLAWSDAAANAEKATTLLAGQFSDHAHWSTDTWSLWDGAYWIDLLAQVKTGQFLRAITLGQTAQAATPNADTALKFRFWIGLVQKRAGNASSTTTFTALMQDDSQGFYGFLAHHELGVNIDPLPDEDLDHVTRPGSVSAANFSVLEHLVAANEYPLAQTYSRQVLKANSIQVDELRLRGFVRDFGELWSVSFAHMTASQRAQILTSHARLFYPAPYGDSVNRAAIKWPHIEPAYVYSIMRQESGFDPFAHSWADAYGLVQILPSNARKMEAKAGVVFKEDYELFEPDLNILLGAAFMDEMYAQMNGSFILRTIAYNATVDKAREWKGRLDVGDVHEFIEEIPYDETQNYVRLVMRNYLMNRRLVEKAPFAFPPDLLLL